MRQVLASVIAQCSQDYATQIMKYLSVIHNLKWISEEIVCYGD